MKHGWCHVSLWRNSIYSRVLRTREDQEISAIPPATPSWTTFLLARAGRVYMCYELIIEIEALGCFRIRAFERIRVRRTLHLSKFSQIVFRSVQNTESFPVYAAL